MKVSLLDCVLSVDRLGDVRLMAYFSPDIIEDEMCKRYSIVWVVFFDELVYTHLFYGFFRLFSMPQSLGFLFVRTILSSHRTLSLEQAFLPRSLRHKSVVLFLV